jgi:TonB family protein
MILRRAAVAVTLTFAACVLAQAADGPRYWRASELDAGAAPLAQIDPVPPAKAGDKPGRVIARVLINESGGADRVLIEESNPPGLFDQAVIAAFKSARYRPGSKHGIRVKSQMRVEVTFHAPAQLSGRKAPAAR